MSGVHGVYVTCSCYPCQLDPQGREDHEGHALAAVRNPDGPVAVMASTRESYSAMGLLAFNALLPHFGAAKLPERLGEPWLDIKKGIASGPIDALRFTMFDYADGSEGRISLAVQRQEHLEMWILLGDPALKLPNGGPQVTLEAPNSAAPGSGVTVHGTLPAEFADAKVQITLERPPGSRPPKLDPVPQFPADGYDAAVMANHAKANDLVLVKSTANAHGGSFHATLSFPEKLTWDHVIIRALVKKADVEALGAVAVQVVNAPTTAK